MSLPHLLGTTIDTVPAEVPYLSARPADIVAWRRRLLDQPRPTIGLVWAGNRKHENDHNRSMPARLLTPLIERSRCLVLQLAGSGLARRSVGVAARQDNRYGASARRLRRDGGRDREP